MNNDREMLELAAKAAGMLVLPEGQPWPSKKMGWFFNQVGGHPPALYDRSSPSLKSWAPLTDDGDALRLAVKLRLDVMWRADGRVSVIVGRIDADIHAVESYREDANEGIRRAIVRAAAEIGKAKP